MVADNDERLPGTDHTGGDTPQSGGGKRLKALVGYNNFVRHNTMSDRFQVESFHHLEFWCGDAHNTSNRFSWGLGMRPVAKSDQSTGNYTYASYVLQSRDMVFTFTAPYNSQVLKPEGGRAPHPGYDSDKAAAFFYKHGLAVRAVGVRVGDAAEAYRLCVAGGGVGVAEPWTAVDEATGQTQVVSEVLLYQGGDAVLRFVSGNFQGPCLANYVAVDSPDFGYGIKRIDHVVGNVPNLLDQVNYLMDMTGFHEFAEFVADDVGTVDSGLNSMVLASNNEAVLLPINEPTFGTRRKSQIQTYLEQNMGPGVQHLALLTDDIFYTVAEMRQRSRLGGFEFMPRASDKYYRNLPEKLEGAMSEDQLKRVEELGLLVDKDDQGVLVQIFTKPLGDRPTIFIEIIQRIGCYVGGGRTEQKAGCGGFGKGNFTELFKSIENYEKELDGSNRKAAAAQS